MAKRCVLEQNLPFTIEVAERESIGTNVPMTLSFVAVVLGHINQLRHIRHTKGPPIGSGQVATGQSNGHVTYDFTKGQVVTSILLEPNSSKTA